MKSIDDLYYGLLIPHEELMRRWAAYESIKNSKIIVHDEELQLKGGRATWMSREYDNCEMAATIRKNFVWKDGQSEVYAFVHTDVACESCSCALLSYWLVRYRDGRFVSSHRIPNNDVEWFPCLNGAPYGRKYTLVVHKKTVEVVNCVTGKVVLTVERKGCARWKCE